VGGGAEGVTAPVTLVLVGCGAIAQRGHLPALALVPEIRCVGLVDERKDVAESLAKRWGIPSVASDSQKILDQAEACLLAVPNHLHAQMAVDALSRGRAVLCEKPLGRTEEEVQVMIDATRRAGRPLVAAMILRQFPSLQQARAAFPWDALGRIQEIRAEYGVPLEWPLSSPHLFDRAQSGGGALMDLGVHLLDALIWVLSLDDAVVVEYRDDGQTGMEAESRATLTVTLPAGRGRAPCLVEVSRLRRLQNRIAVIGDRARLTVPLSSSAAPELWYDNQRAVLPYGPGAPRSSKECFAAQLRAFARVIRGPEAGAGADGVSQARVLKLIDACYRARQPLGFPWQHYEPWAEG